MEPEIEEKEFSAKLEARFKELPKALQDAITSADIANKLKELSETHKLHLDQWQKLENEVMLALMGFQRAEDLSENIKHEVGVPPETADMLAGDIAETIFLPIRENLEKELGVPPDSGRESPEENNVGISQTPSSAVRPATPPAPPPLERAVRAPLQPSYGPQDGSQERKEVAGDPYREPIQ